MTKDIKIEALCTLQDQLLNTDYHLLTINAKILSGYLKVKMYEKGINFDIFNTDGDVESWKYSQHKKSIENPPLEIYQYQNFFLLEQENGDLVLLDGFRRLLWYNVPDIDIQVRVYRQKDMTNQQIMQLLVYLNHTKFFSGIGHYYDRGFGLALNTLFGLDITKYYAAFDGYLAHHDQQIDYSVSYSQTTVKNEIIKERILNPHFIQDIRFIQNIKEDDTNVVNHFFGTMIYKFRSENPDFVFDRQSFLDQTKSDSILCQLLPKYKAASNKGFEIKYGNQVFEIYRNILNTMLGGESVETYAVAYDRAKKLSDGIKKTKEWIKLTNSQKYYEVHHGCSAYRTEHGKSPSVKIVVYPRKESHREDFLPTGVYDDFSVLGFYVDKKQKQKNILAIENEAKMKITGDSYNGYSSRPTYNELEFNGKKGNPVEVWIKLTPSM
jgi:hypothetical protein